jgi:hypothetical protein
MYEEQTAEPEGQTKAESQVTETIPAESEGQSAQAVETPETGPQETDSFFDPNQVPDDLKPAYKNMQAAFTKKMQALAENRQKVEAYDAFTANPMGELQRLATQYGYQLTPAQQQAVAEAAQNETDWQPQSWQEVESKISRSAVDQAKEELMQQFGPIINQVQSLKQSSIENQLSEIDPTWQQYESEMATNLNSHPTLANDPAMLYRMSVPSDVLESRATQAALRKMEAKGQSAQVSSGSSTPKKPGTEMPDKSMSFDEAVTFAKNKIAEDGIKAPG